MKKTQMKMSQESAEELADLKIKLGFAKAEDRDKLIEIHLKPLGVLIG